MRIILALVIAAIVPLSAQAKEVMKMGEFLKSNFEGAPKVTKETFTLSAAQKADLKKVAKNSSENDLTFYYGKTEDGKLKATCTVLGQEGKEGPMTVGVCFEPEGLVKSVRVLNHVEDHGREVDQVSYLKQYNGKAAASNFRIGKDVDGISGATISSEAVSEAVRKAAFGFKTFVKK